MEIILSFEDFQANVRKFIHKAEQLGSKECIKVRFDQDTEKGKYYARAEEILIIGTATSLHFTVRWGCKHQAMSAF